MTDPVLELDTRRRILAAVREYPGLHLRELARQLDTSVALIEYHVPFLVDAGLVRADADQRYQRLYPLGGREPLSKQDRRWLGTLRERIPLQIVLHLTNPDCTGRHKDIAEKLDMGKSKLTFHLQKLRKVGLVEKTEENEFHLMEPARVSRLLLEHKPTPDLREEFADLWLDFYGN